MQRHIVPVAIAVLLVLAARERLMAPPERRDIHVEPTTGMVFVRLPAGAFVMGSPLTEAGRQEDERQHRVQLTGERYMGRDEVTQAQWQMVMNANPSHHADCPTCPVERVSFREAREFAGRLGLPSRGWRYRLPTEAEWEYACRAGTTTPFNTGDRLTTAQANYDGRFPDAAGAPGEARGRTLPVGAFPPNAWGLRDMHGNVWEWTSDWYAPYPGREVTNPTSPASGERRVIRGGSWYFGANSARCALRYAHDPEDRGFSLGVRLVAEPLHR